MARLLILCISVLAISCASFADNNTKKLALSEIDSECISKRPEPRIPDDSLLLAKTKLTNQCKGIVDITGAWHKNGTFFSNGTTGTIRLKESESVVVRALGDGPATYEYVIYKVILINSNGVACSPPGEDLGHSLPGRGIAVLLLPSLPPGDTQKLCTSTTGSQGKYLAGANCYSLNIAQTDLEQRSGWKCESDVVCGDGVIISKIEIADDNTGSRVCAVAKNSSSRSKKILINLRFQ